MASQYSFPRAVRSKRIRSRVVRVALQVAIATLAIGVGGAVAAPGSRSAANTLTIAMPSDPANLDMQKNSVAEINPPLTNIYEALTVRNARTRIDPDLATSWKELTPTRWRFNLRSHVKFQDGEPFNAAAAVFSITRALDPASSNIGYYSTVQSAVAVKHANAIVVTTKTPDAQLPSDLSFLPMVPPNYVTNDASSYLVHPIGTGPYEFVSWTPGVQMVIKANPNWWGGKARYSTVTFKVITDTNVRLQALQAGEVDIAQVLDPTTATLIPKPYFPPSNVVCLDRFNTLSGLFSNLQIRQAANYAIDRKTMAKSLFGRFAAPAGGQLIGRASFGFDTKLGDYPYDPAKAKALLAAAGYKGQQVTLYAYSGHTTGDAATASATAQYLQAAGFNVKLDLLPFAVWRPIYFSNPRPEMAQVCTSDDGLTGFRPLLNLATTTGSQSGVSDPTLDKMITAAQGEANPTKQLHQLWAIAARIKAQAFALPVISIDQIIGAQKNITWTPRLDGLIFVNAVRKK